MNLADKQVMDMVNGPHERRRKQALARKEAQRRRAQAINSLLRLTIKAELCILVICVIVLAMLTGTVTQWLGVLAMALCVGIFGASADRQFRW